MTSVTRLVLSSQQSLGQDLQADVAPTAYMRAWGPTDHIPEPYSPSTQGMGVGCCKPHVPRGFGETGLICLVDHY